MLCRTGTSDVGIGMAARTVVTGQPPTASGLRPSQRRAVHLGAMAGTLDLVQRGLTELETRD